jgi:hypothetical protein
MNSFEMAHAQLSKKFAFFLGKKLELEKKDWDF